MFRPPEVVRKKRLDDRYEVGDNGVIYSNGMPMATINGVGVNIHGERRKVAYLVARAFVRNQEGRPFVRHINGDVTDNRADNLEWSEVEEKKKPGRKGLGGICTAWRLDGERVKSWNDPYEAALETGVEVRLVRKALRGEQKTAGGLLWRWGV